MHRWFSILLFRREKALREMNGMHKVSDEEATAYEKALDYVGLTFPFQET